MSFLCKNELLSPLLGCEKWRFAAKLSVDVIITFHFYLLLFHATNKYRNTKCVIFSRQQVSFSNEFYDMEMK